MDHLDFDGDENEQIDKTFEPVINDLLYHGPKIHLDQFKANSYWIDI